MAPRYAKILMGQFTLLPIIAVVCMTGCQSTYSPPLRTVSFGAPAGVQKGELEMGLSGSFTIPERTFLRPAAGPLFALGVNDWLALEAAGEWSHERALSGHGAIRFVLEGRDGSFDHFDADLAIGGGGGVGGIVCNNRDYDGVAHERGILGRDVACPGDRNWDGVDWYDRPFGGGLIDMGIGWPLRNYALVPFLRLRVQVTAGSTTPTTAWYSMQAGVHTNSKRNNSLHIGLGASLYHNSLDPLFGESAVVSNENLDTFLEVGMSFGFPSDTKLSHIPSK